MPIQRDADARRNCQGLLGFDIEEGHFGAVRLSGLRAVVLLRYPGAIHEGNGTMQVIIDDRADPVQRDALHKIMTGVEMEEMATGLVGRFRDGAEQA